MQDWRSLLSFVGDDFRKSAEALPERNILLVACWIPPGETLETCEHPLIEMAHRLKTPCWVRERVAYDDSGAAEWIFLYGSKEHADRWKSLAESATPCLPADDFPHAAIFRSLFQHEPIVGGGKWARWASFVFGE
jgi:hypothetical protein